MGPISKYELDTQLMLSSAVGLIFNRSLFVLSCYENVSKRVGGFN